MIYIFLLLYYIWNKFLIKIIGYNLKKNLKKISKKIFYKILKKMIKTFNKILKFLRQ